MEPHAHLCFASSVASSGLPEELKKETPDITHLIRPQFGIDDARELVKQSAARGFGGKRRFVVSADSLTPEAQNALLKLFEDPPTDAVFYLVVPGGAMLLPTLRSRLIETAPGEKGGPSEGADAFIGMSYGERLNLIADLAKKDPDALRRLVIDTAGSNARSEAAKRSALLAIKYIGNRGASRKQLAEELALSLP